MYRLEMVVISGRKDFNKYLLYKFDGQSKFIYPNNARIAMHYWDILSRWLTLRYN